MKKKNFGSILVAMGIVATSLCADDAKVVTYEEFGAVGDGKTNDFAAIVKAHEYANKNNLPVLANDNATYYIGGAETKAIIQTNTNWGKAKFMIDDRNVENFKMPVFQVTSKLKSYAVDGVTTLAENQESLDITLPQRALVIAEDDYTKKYIRYGSNANSGASQTDLFIVDKDGKIDMNAPIMWNFDHVSSITAYPIDEETLSITGGIFTTIANERDGKHSYFNRSITIERSNTVVDKLSHYIINEGEHSFPYFGFISVRNCADVIVKNTVFTGHKSYSNINSNGKKVTTGTYDLTITRAVNVSFINCIQTNDINDKSYWGIMGSNYCKNLVYDGCKFSRFDAHQGVYNATIKNSEIGHMGASVIGMGTLLIENSTFYANNMINLRNDYGSTWKGEVFITNCVLAPVNKGKITPLLFAGANNGQHNFGYTAYMPSKITIDGLIIKDVIDGNQTNRPMIFGTFNGAYKDDTYVEKFPFIPTEEVILKNVKLDSGRTLGTTYNTYLFRNLVRTSL